MMENIMQDNNLFSGYPDILTVSQMQECLQIGRSAAYALLHTGNVNFLKIGNSIRIPKRSLLDFIYRSCYNTTIAMDGLPTNKEVIV